MTGVAWVAAGSLLEIRRQCDALAPGRSTVSDGTIGDARHVQEGLTSDHNPRFYLGAWYVTAIDITNDVRHGMPGEWLATSLAVAGDPRVKYIIWDRHIWETSGPHRYQWQEFGGDPHTSHVHLSVEMTPLAVQSQILWTLPVFDAFRTKPLTLSGSSGLAVRVIQTILHVAVDGQFGPLTEKAVREFQVQTGLTVDGIVGPHTWTTFSTIWR